jgi:hypothetical protein
MIRNILVLLIVIAFAVVFWRGWLQFNVANNADQNETNATLTINKDKIKQDLEYLKNREQTVAAQKEIAETTVHGRVQTLDQDQVTVLAADGQTLKVGIMPDTAIRVGGKAATMKDLHPGDPVTVTHVTRENRLVAVSITKGDRQD